MQKTSFVKKLLKNQEEIFDALINREKMAILGLRLFLISTLGLFLYGFLVTTIYPDLMFWVIQGGKLLLLLYGSIAICVPVFYVLLIIKGSEKSFLEMFFLMMGSLSTSSVILLSFLPVAWFFAFSLENLVILISMHVIFIGLSIVFGFVFLIKGIYYIQGKKAENQKKPKVAAALGVFLILLFFVSIQMGKNVSPLFRLTEGFAKIEFKEKLSNNDLIEFKKKNNLRQVCELGNPDCYVEIYHPDRALDPCFDHQEGSCPEDLLKKSKDNQAKDNKKIIGAFYVKIPISVLEHKWKSQLQKDARIKNIEFIKKEAIERNDRMMLDF